jgi:PTH1 family peptidyl-tRNA hydrolase
MVLDRIAGEVPVQPVRSDAEAELWQAAFDQRRVLLLKPQTYMNLSGVAVQRIVQKYKIEPHEMTVVYDDLDLEVGRLRIRKQGGHGGHKGLRSILDHLETPHFVRIRMGIGRPDTAVGHGDSASRDPIVEYVLQPFTREEHPIIRAAVKRAVEAIRLIVADQVDAAMNAYNRGHDE